MAKKKAQTPSTALAVVNPVEPEGRKQQHLDEEFWKSLETASGKYLIACNTAWRKYEAALKADLLENPKRHVRMPYDDQYDEDIKGALTGWDFYFDN
jgi:hypothetical protein